MTSNRNGAKDRITPEMMDELTSAASALAIFLASVLVKFLYLNVIVDNDVSNWPYLTVGLFGMIISYIVFDALNAKRRSEHRREKLSFRRTLFGLVVTFMLLIVMGFLLKISANFSRGWVVGWFGLSVVGVTLTQTLMQRLGQKLRSKGYFKRRIAIFLTGDPSTQLLRRWRDIEADVALVGVYEDNYAGEVSAARTPSAQLHPAWPLQFNSRGGPRELIDAIRNNLVDHVIIASANDDESRARQILNELSMLPVNVHLVSDIISFETRLPRLFRLGKMNLIEIQAKPLAGWSVWKKAVLDYTLTAIFLALLSPIFFVIAIAIKLDSRGPVFFRQTRMGFNNELINIFKFRTMYVEQQDDHAEKLTRPGDPRVTPVGKVLRRFSLDELPQLFNVMTGEMSLVGPRPHALKAKAGGMLYQNAVTEYAARHKVKPGLTGWAQVNGWRGDTETVDKLEKRVEHDLYYINNWSIWFDLRILMVRTLPALLSRGNAY